MRLSYFIVKQSNTLFNITLFLLFFVLACSNQATKSRAITYLKNDSLIIEDLLNQADTCLNLRKANYYNNKAKIFIELQLNKKIRSSGFLTHLSRNLNNEGVFASHFASTGSELPFYYKALGVATVNKDCNTLASIYNNLGFYYSDGAEFDLSLYYFNLSIDNYKRAKNTSDLAYIYSNMGSILLANKDTASALQHYQSALKTAEPKTNSGKQIIAAALNNIANIYIDKKNLTLAKEYLQKAIVIEKELNDDFGYINTLRNLGEIYLGQNQMKLSEECYLKAYQLSCSANLPDEKQLLLRSLVKLYTRVQNTKEKQYYASLLEIASNEFPNQEKKNNTTKTDTLAFQQLKKRYTDSVLQVKL